MLTMNISLSKLVHDINYHKKPKKLISYQILLLLFSYAQNRPYEPNTHTTFYLKLKNTYA